MKLEHVALNLPDPRAAAAWYAENLGLHIVKAGDAAPFAHFLADEGEGMLEFYRNAAGELPDYASLSPFTLHLAFATDDVEGTRQKLLDAGATVAGEIETTPVGDRIVFLRDPWGVALQLVRRREPLR